MVVVVRILMLVGCWCWGTSSSSRRRPRRVRLVFAHVPPSARTKVEKYNSAACRSVATIQDFALGFKMATATAAATANLTRCSRLRGPVITLRAPRAWPIPPAPPRPSRRFSSTPTWTRTRTRTEDSVTQTVSQRLGLPLFRAHSRDVSLLKTPPNFYSTLLSLIAKAHTRIFLSSLYIGKDETELMDALRAALSTNRALRCVVLVDALRSTREGPYAKSGDASCASLLAALARDFPHQVDVRLYRTPGLPPWLESLIGKRLVEGAGLQHMKIYGADDDVIVSGANLSNDYFTNRQDRYVHFRNHRRLSDYLHSLVLATAKFSYNLVPTDSAARHPHHAAYRLEWDQGQQLLVGEHPDGSVGEKDGTGSGQDDVTHREHRFQLTAGSTIQAHTNRWHQHTRGDADASAPDVTITPLVQMGPLSIKHETSAMPLLLSALSTLSRSPRSPSRLDFTSGYFSLFPAYASLLLSLPSTIKTCIIAAAPISNGFYGSRGISRHIPPAYTWLEHKFYNAVQSHGKADDVAIYEWEKEGWTYHAKGLWFARAGEKHDEDATASGPDEKQVKDATASGLSPAAAAASSLPLSSSSPTHTLIGSSNFGSRSALRDLECTLLIETPQSSQLSRDLHEEVEELKRYATVRVDDALFEKKERRVPWGVKVAAEMIKGRL